MSGGLRVVPVTRDQALAHLAAHHRHHGRPQGYRFAVGVAEGDRLVGVAMAGRPVARALDNGQTIEIVRVATDGTPNACSMLYGACWRAARALGYTHGITYTQEGESGASLRASGWRLVAELPARKGWSGHSVARPREVREGDAGIVRLRWEVWA